MKLLVEILLAVFLHPVAFILALVNIAGREDLGTGQKLLWAVVCFFWGVGPILYVALGSGELW
jgi:hypothetical protein